jgi:hypothetical protein
VYKVGEMTLVPVDDFKSERNVGLCSTRPTIYGRPLRVGAGFHCLDDLGLNKDRKGGRKLNEVRSCYLYSNGTNSSNNITQLAVHGSSPRR